MKLIAVFFLSFLTLILQQCKENKTTDADSTNSKGVIVKIKFDDKTYLEWDIITNEIVQNDNYRQVAQQKLQYIATQVSNTGDVGVAMCSKNTLMKKGDIAFLFVKQNGKIPMFDCFGIQFDTELDHCKYPFGMLNYLEDHRDEMQQQLLQCLNK